MKNWKHGIIGILAIIALVFVLIACDDGNKDTHTHTYGTEWKSNATEHWHECTANDGAKTDIANHEWEWQVTTPATYDIDGVETETCTTCGATNGTRSIKLSLTSVAELNTLLASLPDNDTNNPYIIALNITDLTYIATTIRNAGKYISLDFSGSTLTSIGRDAFHNCISLTSVIIPNSVLSIGINAFMDCTSLANINITDSITSIGNWAFFNTSLASVSIPNSVTSIEEGAFGECTSLISVTFEGSIDPSDFSNYVSFPGDLRDKYLSGGIGTYTRESDSYTWTKQ
jgi:hypothetical protein